MNFDHIKYVGIARGGYYRILLLNSEVKNIHLDITEIKVYLDEDSINFHTDKEYPDFLKLKYNSKGNELFEIFFEKPAKKYPKNLRIEIGNTQVACADKRYSLDFLKYDDFNAFQRNFSFAEARVLDEETAREIAINNLADESISSGSIKVTSFSIYTYKSLALRIVNKEDIDRFYLVALDSVKLFSNEEDLSSSIRTNITSRLLSVVASYCHYLIYSGDYFSIPKEFDRMNFIFSSFSQGERKYSPLLDNSFLYIRLLVFKWVSLVLANRLESKQDYLEIDDEIKKCYSHASCKSVDLPNVYLKEFGDVYSIYYQYRLLAGSESISLMGLVNFLKSVSRVNSKGFNNELEKNLINFSCNSGYSKCVFNGGLSIARKPVWQPLLLSNSSYMIQLKIKSQLFNPKAALICFGASDSAILHSKRVSGLSLSANRSLGFYRYLSLNKGDNNFSFYVNIDGVVLHNFSIVSWDCDPEMLELELAAIYELT